MARRKKNPERQGWSLLSLPSYYWAEQGAPRPGITANCTSTPAPKIPVFLSLETFTVNLEPENSDQHLQTNLTLKVGDNEAVNKIKLHMPEVRNRVLLLLSSKTASQIATVEGKKKLASELLAEINQPFEEGSGGQAVEGVLFTSFVIQ